MPVSQKVGPDGCLYVLDWYDRYHCYQDANRDPLGIDRLRGRLYRVRYRGTPRAGPFDLARESDEQLIQRLHSPNIYFRETAQRLLAERNTAAVRSRLGALVLDDTAPRKARLQGLWALVGTGTLETELHLRLLAHTDPAYRAWGVRAAGNMHAVDSAVRQQLAALARDRSADVQLQVAIAARKVEGLDPLPILVDVLAHCGQDKLIPFIVWPNLHPLLRKQSELFVQLAARTDLHSAPALAGLIPRAMECLLSGRSPDALAATALLEILLTGDRQRATQGLSVISAKVHDLDESGVRTLKARLEPTLKRLLGGKPEDPLYLSAELLAARLRLGSVDAGSVRRRLAAAAESDASRLQALEVLIAFKDPALPEAVAQMLSSGSTAFRARVLAVLGRWEAPQLADIILAHYSQLDPELQPLAIELLLQRPAWMHKLLDAVLNKKLPAGVLNANHLRRILDGNDREAIWAVEKAWGAVRKERNPAREKVVAEMDQFLRRQPGDAKAGALVFKKVCAQCHKIYGAGADVGPDLTHNGRSTFGQLLSNVFDPSLVIGPGYQTTTVVTNDGRSLTGLVVENNDQRMVLKLPGGEQSTVPRANVSYVSVSKLSMMPEGIENLMDRQELADLFAFLALDRPPGDPQARSIPGAPEHRQAR
jgi:putative heme-binding domain-containing protein